jgi:hypothetical protein
MGTDLRAAAQQALEVLIRASSYYDTYAEIDALKAALEQPEQEPVARVLQTVGHYHTGRFVAEIETVRMLRNGESLFTHPPRREWRGLTDTERAAVQYESVKRGLSPLEFMELHEAKLKERNA